MHGGIDAAMVQVVAQRQSDFLGDRLLLGLRDIAGYHARVDWRASTNLGEKGHQEVPQFGKNLVEPRHGHTGLKHVDQHIVGRPRLVDCLRFGTSERDELFQVINED